MHAIVLAGQPNLGRLRTVSQAAYEAEIIIQGRPMADYVLDAVQKSPSISSIGFVGPDSIGRPGLIRAPLGHSLLDNLRNGLSTVPPGEPRVLVVTSDLPWLTPTVVEAFLTRAPRNVDIVYPVVPKSALSGLFSKTKRTYIRVRDGVFTGGNLFLVNPAALPRLVEQAGGLLAHRKSPIKLAQDLGWGFLARFFFGRLSLAQIERDVGGRWGVSGRALVFEYPEVGVDVDKPEDWMLAQNDPGLRTVDAQKGRVNP